jgi:hypothetical protein
MLHTLSVFAAAALTLTGCATSEYRTSGRMEVLHSFGSKRALTDKDQTEIERQIASNGDVKILSIDLVAPLKIKVVLETYGDGYPMYEDYFVCENGHWIDDRTESVVILSPL